MDLRRRPPARLLPLSAVAPALFLLSAGPSIVQAAQKPDGAQLFREHCAACHAAGGARAPDPTVLANKTPQAILASLRSGTMVIQGYMLTDEERRAIAEFLTGKPLGEPTLMPPSAFCSSGSAELGNPLAGPRWNGWGVDLANSRFQPAAMAGLRAEQVRRLEVKWAFGYPDADFAFSHPTVSGGRVFVGSITGGVYSLDAASGCIDWSYQTSAAVRSAISLGERVDGAPYVAYLGDLRANVYALDAATGELIWKKRIEEHPPARITGSPVLHDGRLYVPVSSMEEVAAVNPAYACCTFRGSVVALDARTGEQIWKTHTIPDSPRPTGENAFGNQIWGPSGAAVWSAPTLDLERQRIYVATGNNYSNPPASTSDAVLALDMETGDLLWSRQLTEADSWNMACAMDDVTNCPEEAGPDVDFGSSPIIRTLPDGSRILIAPQKSGIVHALNPDQGGAIIWQTRVGRGGILGGVEWGPAADEELLYVAVSDHTGFGGGETEGGMFALRIETGEKVWHTPAPTPACLGEEGCSAAQVAAVTLIPGVAFSGSYDGHLRAYSTANGTILWDFDTVGEYATVNGIDARGGSINGPGPTIVDGILYVNSGYAIIGGKPGNVLLALSVDGK